MQKGLKMRKLAVLYVCVVLGGLMLLPPAALGQGAALLREGIEQYNRENYEEAIEVLTKARAADPASAEAAFYLGMAYRQINDIPNAFRHFSDAVSLRPLTDNAILEMIETATLMDKADVALKWVAVAEEHKVYPARVAFLKGAALAKAKNYEEAIASFEKAKKLDPAYAQAADFQIGVCYMNQRQYGRASELFKSAITQDPLSDMASYARRYQEAAEQWRYLERPLRLTIGVTGQYDSNYRALGDTYELAPAAYNAAIEETKKQSLVMQNTVRLDFIPVLPAPFVFNAGYAALNTLHQRYSTENDTLANSFTLAPGLQFDSFAVNLVANYTHNLKRDPSYSRYSEISSIGPLVRVLLSKNHILEISGAYTRKNYFQAVSNPELEDQTSKGLDSSLGWVWLYGEGGLFNLKVGYGRDNAEGLHYDSQTYRAAASLIYPLGQTLRLQLGAEFALQDYKNANTFFDDIYRKDRTYSGTVGLTWAACKYADVIAQYLYNRVDSNIYAFDYDRHVFSLGVELKF